MTSKSGPTPSEPGSGPSSGSSVPEKWAPAREGVTNRQGLTDTQLRSLLEVNLVGAHEHLRTALAQSKAVDARNYAIVTGICQDKLFAVDGRPQSVTATITAHRWEVPALIERLTKIAQRVESPALHE